MRKPMCLVLALLCLYVPPIRRHFWLFCLSWTVYTAVQETQAGTVLRRRRGNDI
jgi:hypothetical protein